MGLTCNPADVILHVSLPRSSQTRDRKRMPRLASKERRNVDLHIHTSFSDGTCSVREVVDMAAGKSLAAIAVTDHDCIDAYPEVERRGMEAGIEVIPGLELSSEIQGADIHILGYYIDIHNAALQAKLREMKKARYERARKIVRNLNGQGIDLRFDTVLKTAGKGAIGRPHIAAAMLKEELIDYFREAFDKHIGYDSPAYVEKLTLSPRQVFDLIREAGGMPVLAHPGATRVDERIPEFIESGLMGIEVYHPDHSGAQERRYLQLCKTCNLACTGGSDFHSVTHYRSEIGNPAVPYRTVTSLREKRETPA